MRIGIDLGGTKIEGIVMGDDSQIAVRRRVATPVDDYRETIAAIATLVRELEGEAGGGQLSVGLCTPGAVSPATGLMKNCNSTCLNGRPLRQDVEAALARPVRIANDADCLALSEVHTDGAAAGARCVFAVILGTGVGGGIAVNGMLLSGPNGVAGEWGHNPLPWATVAEHPGPQCWCGQRGCIETWLSGPALAREFTGYTDAVLAPEEIVRRALGGDRAAGAVLARYEDRLARALAAVINLLDADVVVLGGGLSNIARLYDAVPQRWSRHVFSDRVDTRLVKARHGDASGARGAAWLWDGPTTPDRSANI